MRVSMLGFRGLEFAIHALSVGDFHVSMRKLNVDSSKPGLFIMSMIRILILRPSLSRGGCKSSFTP